MTKIALFLAICLTLGACARDDGANKLYLMVPSAAAGRHG